MQARPTRRDELDGTATADRRGTGCSAPKAVSQGSGIIDNKITWLWCKNSGRRKYGITIGTLSGGCLKRRPARGLERIGLTARSGGPRATARMPRQRRWFGGTGRTSAKARSRSKVYFQDSMENPFAKSSQEPDESAERREALCG